MPVDGEDGWKVGFYTGDDKTGLEGFLNGDIDVLIGSSAIGTGVDGLQQVCNRLIVNVLPWTAAEFEQLKGRIYRQGQLALFPKEAQDFGEQVDSIEKAGRPQQPRLGRGVGPSGNNASRGRPPLRPLALAVGSPAWVCSRIRLRSNAAKAHRRIPGRSRPAQIGCPKGATWSFKL